MATIVETKENESIMLLQTHYYKASYEEIKEIYKIQQKIFTKA